jgi:hypothetical protein
MVKNCNISEFIVVVENFSLEKILDKFQPEPNSGCWISGVPGARRYINFYAMAMCIGAHRVAWILKNQRPIPPGKSVLHKCDTSRCANPDHLFLGTQQDNVRDAMAKGIQERSISALRRWHRRGRSKNKVS